MKAKNKTILFLFIFLSLFLPFVSAVSQIELSVINPSGDVNVAQNQFFNVTLNVSCLQDNCGTINISLDPFEEHTLIFNETGETDWTVPSGVTEVKVLMVGGGGSGGTQGTTSTGTGAGGGGAGGLIYNDSYNVTPGQVIDIIIGAGGIAPLTSSTGQGGNGGDSIFGTITTTGGGGGGWRNGVGANGGSGGGGGYASAGGTGIVGQGYGGGIGTNDYGGSGGGGASEVGENGNGDAGRFGGEGKNYSSIFGASVGDNGLFAGGGGGGGRDANAGGTGGLGGGGNGGSNSNGISGVNGTGGGGGGSGDSTWKGGNGGSGIVIVQYEILSTEKGLINTTIGAIPFYTNATNPLTTTSLDSGKSELVTFWVNATGDLGTTYTFFAYANLTSDMGISNITNNWNVTIIETDNPQVTINFPSGTIADITPLINISLDETGTIWYNLNNGTNTTICTGCSSTDSTYLHLAEGSYTIYVFANDSFGNLNNTESNSFIINMSKNYYDNFDDNSSVKDKSESIMWVQGEMRVSDSLWWNTSYNYNKQLNISNNDDDVLKEGYSINLTLDTETMINEGKLKADCSDLRVVWWNGISFIEIDRINETLCDSASTEIWFKLQENISVSAFDNNYYIYYGNSNPGVPPENRSNIYWFWDDFNEGNSDKWTVDGGIWAVNANNEYNQSANDAAYMSTSAGESWWDNYIVETKMNVYAGGATNGFASVLVRYQSAGNYYAIILDDRDPDSIWIRQFIDGAYSGPEWDDVNVDRDTWVDLKVEVLDNNGQDTIRAYFDGIVHEYNYTQYSNGKIGLMMHGTQGAYDNIKVRGYVDSEPTVLLNEEETPSILQGNFTSYSINTTNNLTSIDNVTWTEDNTDANNNITVQVSADNGQNWYTATNGQALGQEFTGLNNSLTYRVFFLTDEIRTISLLDMNISWSEEEGTSECSPILDQDWIISDTQTCDGIQVTTGTGKIIISGEGRLYLINGADVTTNNLEISTTGDKIFINSGSKLKVE